MINYLIIISVANLMNSWFEDEVRLDVFIAPVGNDATDALTS